VQLLAAKDSQLFFCLKLLWISDILSAVYYPLHPPWIMNIRLSLLTISHKLFHPLLELLTLHRALTKKCAWIRSLYHLLIWRSWLWKSEMDVQGRWLCALETYCSDVQHYVEIKFLQWFLPIIVHDNLHTSKLRSNRLPNK
jgi:hypothetical protein